MTLQALFDQIQMQFPKVGEAQMEVLLDNAFRQFCTETELIRGALSLTPDGASTEFDLSQRFVRVREVIIDGKYTAYRLPVNKSGVSVPFGSYVYQVIGDRVIVGKSGSTASEVIPVESTQSIKIYGSLVGLSVTTYLLLYDVNGNPLYDSDGFLIYAEGSSLTVEPDVDPTWHIALADHALHRLNMGSNERLNIATQYRREWTRMFAKARRQANLRKHADRITPLAYNT